MDDLISRAALLEEFQSLCGPQTGDGWDNMGVRNLIVRQKTVDAVEVVRCKDCVYYNTNGCSIGFGWCEDAVVNTGVYDDFYCANGERMENDA